MQYLRGYFKMAICPNCGDKHLKYEVSRKDNWKGRTDYSTRQSLKPRENFKAKCKKCGWEGEIR